MIEGEWSGEERVIVVDGFEGEVGSALSSSCLLLSRGDAVAGGWLDWSEMRL